MILIFLKKALLLSITTLKTPSLLILRFPGDDVADLHGHPPGCVFGAAHIHLPLHHGSPQPPTTARHHRSTWSSDGEWVLQTVWSSSLLCERTCHWGLSGVPFLIGALIFSWITGCFFKNLKYIDGTCLHKYFTQQSGIQLHYHTELSFHSWASRYCSTFLAVNTCSQMFRAVLSCPLKANTQTCTMYTQITKTLGFLSAMYLLMSGSFFLHGVHNVSSVAWNRPTKHWL